MTDLKAPVQKIELTEDGLKLKTPFSMTISGPSQCGKSEFIFNLVKFRADIVTCDFKRIIYSQSNIFSVKNQQFIARLKEEFELLEVIQGLPDITELHLTYNNEPALLIIDDQMSDILNSQKMVEIATVHAHNYNLSVAFVLQNFYASGKFAVTLQKNCQYKVLFYNRGDLVELRSLSVKISNNARFLQFNFEYLMEKYPNSMSYYLLIDSHYRSKVNKFWCRSHIFPQLKGGDVCPVVFFPNEKKK